ncbi:MAG: hypothetical protein ACO3A4_08190 [Silvanigrellaceae bacterium]
MILVARYCLLFVWVAAGVFCNGCKTTVEQEKVVPAPALTVEVKEPSEKKISKRYESRSSLSSRLERLVGSGAQISATDQKSPRSEKRKLAEGSPGSQSNDESNLIFALEMLLSGERWNDVLSETHGFWNDCLGDAESFDDTCTRIGEARGVAFVRNGRMRSALEVYDAVASRKLNSRTALVFAGLLADVSSFNLCAKMASSGLQWEPFEFRQELYAMQAKCLRLDGRLEDARAAISLSLVEHSDHPGLLLESALLFLTEKNLTRGCDLLERLYLKDFSDVAVSYNWGRCLIGRKDTESARRVLERGRRDWPSERVWFLLSGEISALDGDLLSARRDALDYMSGSTAGDVFRPQAERLMLRAQGE